MDRPGRSLKKLRLVPRHPFEIIEPPDRVCDGRSRLCRGRYFGWVTEGPIAASLVLAEQPHGHCLAIHLVGVLLVPDLGTTNGRRCQVILQRFSKNSDNAFGIPHCAGRVGRPPLWRSDEGTLLRLEYLSKLI